MSAREEIEIIIFDDELVDAFNRITEAKRAARGISKTKDEIVIIGEVAKSRDVRDLIKNIPTLTRAQRLIATQIPMAREVLGASFRAKLVAGADPVTMIAILSIYVVQQIKQIQETIKQERINYENMLQEGLDLNYLELRNLTSLQTGFATWWDQFLEASETQGFIQAIISIVKAALPAIMTSPSTEPLIVEGFAQSGQRRDWWMLPSAEDMIRGNSLPVD